MLYRQHGDNAVGATDVKSFKYRLTKFMDPKTASAKDEYYAQALLFMERYYDRFDAKTKETIEEFLAIQNYKKISRMKKLIKGKYLKGDIVRILGQLWYI